jgi:hypothetical protein
MKELLLNLNACNVARLWAEDKTWKEIYETCHRGDWLLWLFKRTNPDDLKLLILAKGHCANTVRHLMKDERSIKAVDAAIAFGNGLITDAAYAELKTGAADAAAYTAAYADAVAVAVYDAAAYVAYAGADAGAYAAGAVAAAAAKKANQLLTANIVRQYIPIDKWNINM